MTEQLPEIQGLRDRLKVETSEGHPVYLLAVGKNPIYIRLSVTSYYLLEQHSLGVSFESLSETLSQSGRTVSSSDVEAAYNQVIEKIANIELKSQKNSSLFFFRFPLLPKILVRPIAKCLSVAFSRPGAYSLLAIIAFAIAIAPRNDFKITFTPADFWWGYLLFLGSLLMHELGHASACSRYNAEPSDIGFTIYMIWPAFYSDVSAAWKLKRWQRVIVDVGGVFFQLVVAAIYVFIYTIHSWASLKLALLMILGSCLFTLNPVFKFDGYWVVADALGVTNLDRQPSRIVIHFFNKLRGIPVNPLPWSPLMISVLAVYTVLSFAIWAYFLWAVLPILWQEILNYPSKVILLIPNFLKWPPVLDIKQLQSFFASTFTVIITLLMFWRLTKLVRIPKLGHQTSKTNLKETITKCKP